jgi:hypothetical protein
MNRRNFLTKLGFGTAAVAATTVVPAITKPKEAKLEDGNLRPKCPRCSTRMLVRHGEGRPYAFCPLTTCKEYGVPLSLLPLPNVHAERFVSSEELHKQMGIPSSEEIMKQLKDELDKVDIAKEDKRGRPVRTYQRPKSSLVASV